MEWKDKIQIILDKLDISQRQLAAKCEVAPSYFNDVSKGRNSAVSITVLTRLINLGISPDWLLFDRGSVMSDDEMQIPILDVQASAGYGRNCDFADPPVLGYLDLGIEIKKKYGKHDYMCVQVVGDSMQPTFMPSDIVVIAVGMINGDGVYVINDDGSILIKRLQFVRESDRLVIISDNHEYQKREISLREYNKYIGIVGRVVCKAQLQ
jgi:phage repressor protein C with HTH and peptisase S24 domain